MTFTVVVALNSKTSTGKCVLTTRLSPSYSLSGGRNNDSKEG